MNEEDKKYIDEIRSCHRHARRADGDSIRGRYDRITVEEKLLAIIEWLRFKIEDAPCLMAGAIEGTYECDPHHKCRVCEWRSEALAPQTGDSDGE